MIKKAVILAGGEGTRLRPVTLEIPKPLVPVQGVPILTWLVRLFSLHGVEEVIVIYPTRWKEAFEKWKNDVDLEKNSPLGKGRYRGVAIGLFEEREPMGTMGAIVHELHVGDDPIFVSNGDELKGLDLTALAATHSMRMASHPELGATIALVRVPNPSEYGVAEFEGGMIAHFHEKPEDPPTDLISSGIFVLNPSSLESADRLRRFLMFEKDLFPQLAASGRLAGCTLEGPWYDCGTMERWEAAISEWPGLLIRGEK